MSDLDQLPETGGSIHTANSPLHDEIYEQFIEAVHDYAVLTLDSAGCISSWNHGAERLFGRSGADALGRPVEELCPPADRADRKLQRCLSAADALGRTDLELRLTRGDGSFEARVDLSLLRSATHEGGGYCLIAHDLTVYRQRLRELTDQKRRLRSIVETAIDAIIIIDNRGLIDSVNRGAERMFGYAQEELLGRNVSLLMPEPYASEHDGYIQRYLQTGNARIIGIGRTVQARRKDGSLFPADLAVSAFEDGRPYFTGILRDVTVRKSLEAEILHIAETEQRRIGQELHDDIQQQLTGLTLFARHLADGLGAVAGDDPRLASLQKIALRIANGLRETNQSLRELARGLVPLHVDSEGLSAALASLAKQVRELYAIDCAYAGEPTLSGLDAQQTTHLYRIAQEAVQNILKHASAKKVSIRLFERDAQLALEISDDGVGVDREAQSSGRGLHIMAHRADLIGAVLTVRRGEPDGTIVCCALPFPRSA
ncbi:PAS domain-containing sensor histidine kinase [Planctellipticum variicoloris]|uniref:PAS domain-containing sensor histidine kinase n=1 Tax=Planctellipticum variicoloris TaxID=3064265 RepID=UPI0030133E37|nr:PAS domain S-box protein [Planctomycetaceae bacterium SH412]